ncbi:uncharacterized protein K02A2.6-like [Topomyia yanbarensis]|uniref:uncharacterized protein K02A2.6-like n=1 Tax=Topomyia yanbarensis TaxID=2498891 RepID=UPI00273C6CF4|nr:uncharacterized protein K02A2.6-like [Topomyia yanbarensis]
MVDPDNNVARAGRAAAGVPPPSFTIDPFDKRKLKWMRWVERLENAFIIYAVDDVDMRKSLLLHHMGAESYDIICDKIAPDAPRDKTYQQIVDILETFFNPRPLEISENFRFKCRRQGDKDAATPEESVDEYLVALRRIAVTCNFGQYLETALRNQLVFGIKRNDIRSRLLEKRELTLQSARDIAVSMELSKKGGAEIEGCQGKQEVHKVQHQSGSRPGGSQVTDNQSTLQTNFVDNFETNGSDKSPDIREVCSVNSISDNEKLWMKVRVNGVELRFEVDTGSPVTIHRCAGNNGRVCRIRRAKLAVTVVRREIGKTSVNRTRMVDAFVGRLEQNTAVNEISRFIPESNRATPDAVPDSSVAVKKVLLKFPRVFEESIGKISRVQANLPLKKDARPVFLKARKIPFNLQKVVEAELDKLVEEGVLTKVNQSNWATPIVPVKKSNNRVRICGDYKKTVNPNLVVDKHPLPTVDELFTSLAGGKKFSKIDLVQAYLQLEVAPEDREILTLSTHRGLYRPSRLMYGVASAPAIWQRQMEALLQGIEGVSVFLDDIKVTGPNDETHLRRLEEVLRRLDESNIRVNRNKCVFFANEIEYCGYLIDCNGIHKIQKKVDAIQEMRRPENKNEVRSFVGLINYYGRFFYDLSTVLYPLNNLLKKDVPFKWSKQCEKSFQVVKKQMQAETCLVHYSPELPLLLATDASPYGVGAILSHIYPDGSERPIQFASQTLNRTQQAYLHVDKEAYAIIFGVKKFFQFLYGRKFVLVTDNQAVTKIFAEHKGLPVMSALRMQHYATYLQSFDYEIRFRKSAEHANVDALSRIPLKLAEADNIIEESDLVEMHQIETLPLTVAELAQATAEDLTVKNLIQGVKYSILVTGKDRFGIDQSEFAMQKGCLLRGIRVYVPPSLRKRVLDELHSTHFGTTRTKSLARGFCWWMGMDNEIEEMIANCINCQSVRPEPAKMLLHCWEAPTAPFERVHVDFAGPFMDTYFFILVDAFTKWPEVRVCSSITADSTIRMCREIFSIFEIPSVLVTDHGVQFTSEQFQQFLRMNGITHKMGAPYHPATNGQAERFVQTIKQKLKSLKCTKAQLNAELCNILLTYRKMLHPATGQSPAMMMFGRQIRSRIDLMLPKNETVSAKNYTVREFKDGDRARVRDFLSAEKWKFGRIAEKVGKLRYAVRLDDGRCWERHIDHIVGVGAHLPETSSNSTTSINLDYYSQGIDAPTSGVSTADYANKPSTTAPVCFPETRAVQRKEQPDPDPEPEQGPSNCRTETVPLRRSTRVVKAPTRLNL